MAEWLTPKTNWVESDYINASDYNRIKNNLQYIYDRAVKIGKQFEIPTLGADKVPGDLLYAEEMNNVELALELINSNTYLQDIGVTMQFIEQGGFPNYAELNRLERATLLIYELQDNALSNRRKFVWNFGLESDF